MAEAAAPLGPAVAAAPPPVPPVPDDVVAPVPDVDALPVPAVAEVSAAGAVLEDDDEAPGTTIVSFSFVTVDVAVAGAGAEPLGTTVVSFFSHAVSASAPMTANAHPLSFMSTLLSSMGCESNTAG